MNCSYPNCRRSPLWTPVVEMPTLRTVGVIKPKLSQLVQDYGAMQRFGLNQNQAIHQYETELTRYRLEANSMVKTEEPTYLIFVPVCEDHKKSYNLFNWYKRSDWSVLMEAARHHGLHLPEPALVVVLFKPLGWRPNKKMELGRDRMRTE